MKASSSTQPRFLSRGQLVPYCCSLVLGLCMAVTGTHAGGGEGWPAVKRETKPWAYWWWMASAVDTNNLAKELARYREAGMGGVHIIPIYGAKGWESNYIPYLSPKWMEMLDFTVCEATRLGLGVDMTTGTGWCFGGPLVTVEEANALMVSRALVLEGNHGTARGTRGSTLVEKFDRATTQALMAFGPDGQKVDLLDNILPDGSVDWVAPDGRWTIYAITQKPGPQKVKRAAPGGEGWMLNLAYPQAMTNYLRWFDEALTNYAGARPRAQYHDSYEYKLDWSPALFAEFEQRRGYRLQDELDVFLTGEPPERAARVKCDYRETLSDLMVEETLPLWVQWAHDQGFITRNEAHGSPGNWLDLYAVADIPETEMFYKDRNKLISKFASSAAHVTGKPLVASETGTWLAEHFTETLADMKYLADDLFLSGVNHIFYHGTCYSPDEAPWPGWVFYASYEMNPRNAIWRDVDALNAYVTRCQSVLQSGRPDNDILLYWPIHDFWSDPEGTVRNMNVHARDWFEAQPIGETAEKLWNAGYQFDYVSDRQLSQARVKDGVIETAGGGYRVIVVPPCRQLPLATLRRLLDLADAGARMIFEDKFPSDVSGGANLQAQRSELHQLISGLAKEQDPSGSFESSKSGQGVVSVGNLQSALTGAGVQRERLFDLQGMMCIRRALPDGCYYFIANRGTNTVDDWVPLATHAQSVCIMDPMTGSITVAASRLKDARLTEVRLKLSPGASVILRMFDSVEAEGPTHTVWEAAGEPVEVGGEWQVKFLSGGPELPARFTSHRLDSWTESGDTNAIRFAGSALYTLVFDAPADGIESGDSTYQLDIGEVSQSARVRLNGEDYGTWFTPPFCGVVNNLKRKNNVLEVEVTNTSANRIRDLDQRGVQWQNFHDINFVNLNYKKFDASNWPVANSGLLGPVTLTPVQAVNPQQEHQSYEQPN